LTYLQPILELDSAHLAWRDQQGQTPSRDLGNTPQVTFSITFTNRQDLVLDSGRHCCI